MFKIIFNNNFGNILYLIMGKLYFNNGDWGLGIGDWGLGIGDWEIGRAHV